MKKFYQSKWFVPTVLFVGYLLVTFTVGFVMDDLHLWFALFLIVVVLIISKIIVSILKTIF